MTDSDHATRRALSGLLWSLAQNWGGRALTFVLFLILARLLSPAEFGLASAVALVILLIGMVAEFGFGDAIVQRRDLSPRDVDLPFFVSMGASIALAAVVIWQSGTIETRLGLPGLGPLIALASLSAPVLTASAFQEAHYRRALEYRPLAIRLLVATTASGVVGIGCAFAGLGALSLVLQAMTLAIVGTIWLWRRPKWLPSREIDVRSFRRMAGYGIHVVGNRLLDFGITRTIDVLVLTFHGAAALGLYTVGSRVYQTAMQLLTTSISDVSLSAVSRIVDDRERTRRAYLRSIATSAVIASPAFVAVAALSPEVSLLLFGAKWAGSEAVMTPLMLLGALQCVQFMNGAYFGALGRPSYVFHLNLVKCAAVTAALVLGPSADVGAMTTAFAVAQLAVTPLTYVLLARLLAIPALAIPRVLIGPAAACAAAYAAVSWGRPWLAVTDLPLVVRTVLLGTAFVVAYLAMVAVVAREPVVWIFELVRGRKARPAGE